MKRISNRIAVAVVAGLALAAPGELLAQDQSSQNQNQQQNQQQSRQQRQSSQNQNRQQQSGQGQSGQEQTIRGKLLALGVISAPGVQNPHVVATLQAQDGTVIFADLGTLSEVRRANLRQGQDIEASGQRTQFNDAPGLIVTRVKANNQEFQMGHDDPGIDQQASSQTGNRQQQMQRRQMQNQQMQTRQMQQQASNNQQMQVVKGRVIDARTVNLRGGKGQHLLAKVRTSPGDTRMIDLGRTEDLTNLTLRQNEYIAARGQTGRVSGTQVLMAREFSDGERVFPVKRSMQQNQRQNQQANRSQQNGFISGKITDVRAVNLKGLSDKHQLIKMQTSQGRTVVVDLGTEKSAREKRLEKGDSIIARGQIGRINGKPVLFADHVAEVSQIDRSSEQQNRQRSQPQRMSNVRDSGSDSQGQKSDQHKSQQKQQKNQQQNQD